MKNATTCARLILLAALAWSTPALASDDAFELWLNPSISTDLDDDTGLEFETAQRLRSRADDRPDTYYARLWVHQDLSDRVTLSGAAERRMNDPGDDETRFIQQVSTRHGLLRTRLRLEQRFVDNQRMGFRVRPRLGVDVPLGERTPWSLQANAELFLTVRSTSAGGQDGLTGLRAQVGVSYELSKTVAVSLAYLRQQDIVDRGSDRVGHAPLIGLELSF